MRDSLENGLRDGVSLIAEFLPKLVLFLIILIVGLIVAKAIAKALSALLEKVGFDRCVERGGVLELSGRHHGDVCVGGAPHGLEQLLEPLGEHLHLHLLQGDRGGPAGSGGLQVEGPVPRLPHRAGDEAIRRFVGEDLSCHGEDPMPGQANSRRSTPPTDDSVRRRLTSAPLLRRRQQVGHRLTGRGAARFLRSHGADSCIAPALTRRAPAPPTARARRRADPRRSVRGGSRARRSPPAGRRRAEKALLI